MKTGTAKIVVKGLLTPVFAMLLLAGGAQAVEPQAADALMLAEDGELAALGSEALQEASGGFAVQMIANTEQQATFTDNPITVDNGGQINTGTISALSGNSGGISTMLLNSGNNVSIQNSTNLNIYLDASQ